MGEVQPDLFAAAPVRWSLPAGFRYEPEVLSAEREAKLVAWFPELPFREFEFRGYQGKRRVVSYGWQYDFNTGALQRTDDMPPPLIEAREIAAHFAGIVASDLQHVLVTEYGAGAAIGWHRDRREFGDVVGLSLLSPCTFRLRRKAGAKWERASLVAEPRSAYLLRGPSRTEWEHSIPAVDALRYSITFRNLRT
jgi:alkylated DNA repair dioxygenase AlkB